MNKTIQSISFAERVSSAYERLSKDSLTWKNEEEVRIALVRALEQATDITLNAERGKEDLSYNNVIIECKGPGLFRGSKTSAKFLEARDERIMKYIVRRAAKEGRAQEDYIGVMFDGDYFCFATVQGNTIRTEHLLEVSEYSLMLVAQALKADLRRPVTSEAILNDFGHGSEVARNLMQSLADTLAYGISQKSGKIPMLFNEWKSLYGQVSDLSAFQTQDLEKASHSSGAEINPLLCLQVSLLLILTIHC